MVKESSARQHAILSTTRALGAQISIYQAGDGYRTSIDRRAVCLEHLAQAGFTHLMLESEQGEEDRDRRQLLRGTGRYGCRDQLAYGNATVATEPLLAIPDAVAWAWAWAWAWARGGDARRRAKPLVTGVVRL